MTQTIALLGALGTKVAEYAFTKQGIEAHGHRMRTVNMGI